MFTRIVMGIAILLGGISVNFYETATRHGATVANLQLVVDNYRKTEKEREDLFHYTLRVMSVVQSPLSQVLRDVVAKQIATVTHAMIKEQSRREAFIVMLSIESKYSARVKSPVGAVGIGQIMPQFASEFAGECGLGETKVVPDDLIDTEINLRFSACHFNLLLDKVGGNGALALAAYNAGLYSKTRKDLESLRNVNDETANYIAKHTMVTEAVRDATVSAAPETIQ